MKKKKIKELKSLLYPYEGLLLDLILDDTDEHLELRKDPSSVRIKDLVSDKNAEPDERLTNQIIHELGLLLEKAGNDLFLESGLSEDLFKGLSDLPKLSELDIDEFADILLQQAPDEDSKKGGKKGDGKGKEEDKEIGDKDGESPKRKDIESELDEAENEGTRPDVFSEEFISTMFPGRTADCGIRLSLPTITVPAPALGRVQGMDDASKALTDIFNLVNDMINVIRGSLPVWVDNKLNQFLGRRRPAPPMPPIPGMNNWFMHLLWIVGKAENQIFNFPPRITAQTPTPQSPHFTPKTGKIHIGTTRNQEVAVQFFSQMTSSYTFGVGAGTSYAIPGGNPPIMQHVDRPWFGKAFVPKNFADSQEGSPYRMRGTANYWIAQLGITGPTTAFHMAVGDVEVLSHGADIYFRPNGNYGRARILVIPPAPCNVVSGTLSVSGPYEEDIVAQEDRRFIQLESERENLVRLISSIQMHLMYFGIAATLIPIVGPLVNLALRRLGGELEDKKHVFIDRVNRANRLQRARNYALAEIYPERGPVGGPEDNPL